MKDTCLYFHISSTKQEVFYVGIGSLKRPYAIKKRSKFWKNYTKKNPNYQIIIIHENLTWEEADNLEIQYILQIGRRDLKKGTLVNRTSGGKGTKGYVLTKEQRLKLSKSHKGKKRPELSGLTSPFNRAVCQYSLTGEKIAEFVTAKEAGKQNNITKSRIRNCALGRYNVAAGFIWRFKTPKFKDLPNTKESILKSIEKYQYSMQFFKNNLRLQQRLYLEKRNSKTNARKSVRSK